MATVTGGSNQVEGVSHKGDFAEALKNALSKINGAGDVQHIWKLNNVQGLVGGLVPKNDLTIVLDVHMLYLESKK